MPHEGSGWLVIAITFLMLFPIWGFLLPLAILLKLGIIH